MSFGFGAIYHCVDFLKNVTNNKIDDASGRWFMGLYSTVSDYVTNRHIVKPAKI